MRHHIRRPATVIALAALFAAALPATALAAGQDAAPAAPAASDPQAAVAAALQAAAPAKLMVAERFAQTHDWAADAAAIGYQVPPGAPATVDVDHGTIAIGFTAPEALAGSILWLTPADGGDGRVTWTCETTLPAGLKPEGCR